MKRAEVITVRSAVRDSEYIDTFVQELVSKVKNETNHKTTLQVFRHEKLDSDICIVLLHTGKNKKAGESVLGLHLATALKEVGLVNHAVWRKIDSL